MSGLNPDQINKPHHVLKDEAYRDLCDASLEVEESAYTLTNVIMNDFSLEQIDDALIEVRSKLHEAKKIQHRRRVLAEIEEVD